jgi:hypothetical protein
MPCIIPNTPILNTGDAYLLISTLWDHDLINLQEHMAVYLSYQQQVVMGFGKVKWWHS